MVPYITPRFKHDTRLPFLFAKPSSRTRADTLPRNRNSTSNSSNNIVNSFINHHHPPTMFATRHTMSTLLLLMATFIFTLNVAALGPGFLSEECQKD